MKPGEQPPARRLSRTPEAKRAMRMASRLALRGRGAAQSRRDGSPAHGNPAARRGLGYEILIDHNVTRTGLRDALRGGGRTVENANEGETDMTREEVQRKLIEMAAEQAGVSASEITPATHFHNDLNYDSLDDVEYAMNVEDALSLSVADEDVEKLQTIEAVTDYVMGKLEAAPAT